MSFSTPVDDRLTEHVLILIKDIYTSKGGALTKWNKIVTILRQHNISYKRLLRNVEVIVHPRNRGGLGVNAHNVHKNSAAIKIQRYLKGYVVSRKMEKKIIHKRLY